MRDAEAVRFLQWALPQLRMRWPGFRKVRGQVAKRLRRRVAELGLPDLQAYRHCLEADDGEWGELDARCRVTISRFLRDRSVWMRLGAILKRRGGARAWCAGCASGEEPYSLAMIARESGAGVEIVASDADPHLLTRAQAARYGRGSLRELSPAQVEAFFEADGADFVLRRDLRRAVSDWRCEDLRVAMPDGPFDLVFCRNLAFTYFDEELQREILAGIRRRLAPDGVLALGTHEEPPSDEVERIAPCLFRWPEEGS